jgi:hypothetical protein
LRSRKENGRELWRIGRYREKVKISDGKRKRTIENWEVQGEIEKQPEEVNIGLHNLAVQKGPYRCLRMCCRDAAFLSAAYEKFQQPVLERRAVSPSAEYGTMIHTGHLERKATDGPCRLCEGKGIKVMWSRAHAKAVRKR